MRIKAKANGNVIEAHPDAAKELIEAGIYERASDKDKLTSELPPANPIPPQQETPESPTAVKPMGTEDFVPAPKTKVPARGKTKK